ncbi:MAG: glycosyl hydrolase family 18 protein [Bacteroidales bacterium]|jgi:spore germination protein YaaH|nr:glycosyl hydrolase family 18 protein [Bacteroidales bacterium]
MLTRLALLTALLALTCLRGSAQDPDTEMKGIHQAESEYYSTIYGNSIPPGHRSPEKPVALKSSKNSDAAFRVYGWHPYWAGTNAHLNYDYNVLTHIAYFSYEVDTASGYYTTLRGWDTTPVIGYAHQRGVKVMLTVTNFGSERNTKILTDTVKQWRLIDTLVGLLKSRNGDGVNFDFEIVPSAMKANMVSFCKRAVRGIKSELPQAEISFATPAVNWSDGWDLAGLAANCDYLIMMGYNYYYGGSSTAGPVAPLTGENYNISKSVDEDYLGDGVPQSKLLLGMPWYGYDWPVGSNVRKAATTGTGTSRVYSATLPMVASHGKTFDSSTAIPWMSYQGTTGWRQMWFEDSLSLLLKTNYAHCHNLAGVGIWALSYEGGRPELWNGIKAVLAGTVSSDVMPIEPVSNGSRITRINPNPAVEEAVVQYYIAKPGKITLAVYDTGGRLMALIADGMAFPGIWAESISTGKLSPGLYLCVLTTPGGRHSVKFAVAGKN